MITMNRLLVFGCWVAGAGLVLMNVRLAEQNRALSGQVEGAYRSLLLPEGARVPPLVGIEREGRELTIDPAAEENPILILVFSPFCPACDDNWPNWQPLLAAQRAAGGRAIAVDITGTAADDYISAYGLDSVPVVINVTPETNLAYRFRFTPQTIILDEGKLAAGWTGVLTEADVRRAVRLLGGRGEPVISDPGLPRVRPACDGLSCRIDSHCGSRCTCEGATPDSLGICVARSSA